MANYKSNPPQNTPQFNRIPRELRDLDQWVGWLIELSPKGKPQKVPYQASAPSKRASSTAPKTWASCDQVFKVFNNGGHEWHGIACVIKDGGGHIGVDLDDCYEANASDLLPLAQRVVDRHPTYIEVSPSGEGIKAWYTGRLADVGSKRPSWAQTEYDVEVYDKGRFFTVTTWMLPTAQSELSPASEDLMRDLARLAAANAIAKKMGPDNRHFTSSALAGWLLRNDWSDDGVRTFCPHVAKQSEKHSEPGDADDQMAYVESTIEKYRSGEHDGLTGFPDLSDRVSEDLLVKVGRWLGFRSQRDVNLNYTDAGNAHLLADRYGEVIRYAPETKMWYVWDGTRWAEDVTQRVHEHAEETIRAFAADSLSLPSQQMQAALEHARRSLHDQRLNAMVDRAGKSIADVKVRLDEFDTDPWLLNVQNGTIDLRTGELRPHDIGDMITKITGASYNPSAPFVVSQRFLNDIFEVEDDDEDKTQTRELVEFVQRLIGLTLIGEQIEAILPISYGTGRNGKGTFIEVVAAMLGEYAIRAPREMFYQYKNAQHPTDIADLRGVRFAYSNEGERERQLAEDKIKDITGGETITGRKMHQDFQQFKPSHTLWLAANHKPIIMGTDKAIWERVKLMPNTMAFVDDPDPDRREKKRDPHIKEELFAELDGWLAWALEGCLWYQRDGLMPPDVVKNATAAYRDESDQLGMWIEERCIENRAAVEELKHLWNSFQDWAIVNNEPGMKKGEFTSRLEERGLRKQRGNYNKLTIQGLALPTRQSETREMTRDGELTLTPFVEGDV